MLSGVTDSILMQLRHTIAITVKSVNIYAENMQNDDKNQNINVAIKGSVANV